MPNVRREDFDKIVKIYNESGSKSTMEYIKQNYGIKYPRGVLSRIKKSPAYSYDPVSNKFLCKNEPFDKSIFLGIDELCMPTDSVGLAAASSVCFWQV